MDQSSKRMIRQVCLILLGIPLVYFSWFFISPGLWLFTLVAYAYVWWEGSLLHDRVVSKRLLYSELEKILPITE